jgi:NAD-dependent deacetylase
MPEETSSTATAATSSTAARRRLAELLRSCGSVVALTGAGVSVPSGIPDFRSPGTGLWERVNPMDVAHIDVFRADPERFWRFYGERFGMLQDKRPNEVHHALVTLERAGMLDAVITQNIDTLHRRAGTKELIEVHGSIEHCSCPACATRVTLARAQALLAADERGVPRCERCGAPLKPDVVLFGEMLPAAAIERAQELCASADLLLCIGSSLEVHPVADLPLLTDRAGGAIAIITKGSTPLDGLAAVQLDGELVDEMRALLEALGMGSPPSMLTPLASSPLDR